MYSSESMEGREACGETAGSQEETRDNGEEEEEEEDIRVEPGDRLKQTGPRGTFPLSRDGPAGILWPKTKFCPCTTKHNINGG